MRLLTPVLSAFMLSASMTAFSEVPRPVLPEPIGEQCVEPTQVMRERHWEFILHQRDETVHRGIRTKKHSLKNCLECHVRADDEGQYPRADETEHFCEACHVYAGVTMDCFECHADRPMRAYDPLRRHDRLSPSDLAQP